MNIILIGMPAAGKSTVGVILAKLLGYQFLDTDLIIQTQEKKLLKEIIDCYGIEGFLNIENKVNASIQTEDSILATGGSVIYGEEAMKHLKTIGVIVYLRLSYDTIIERLDNVRQRGVVLKDGQSMLDLYIERCPLYELYANVIIDAENLNIEELANKIIQSV